MRLLPLAMLVLVAGCSPANTGGNAADASENAGTPLAVSPEQRAARAVAAGYLADVSERDFDAARARWADNGKAAGGSAADLGRAYDQYKTLTLSAGEAEAISVTGDVARVVVPVTGAATMVGTGEARKLAGNIYLQRTRGGDPNAGDTHGWHIWAADIRRDH